MELASGSSSIGEAVSGRGDGVMDGDEDLFYIPERRPSLDLGPNPMDTSQWNFVGQAAAPVPSYWSMTSEEKSCSMDHDDGSGTRVQLDKADSFSSCYSLDSDYEERNPKVKDKEDTESQLSDTEELIKHPAGENHPSLTVAFTFTAISNTLRKLSSDDLKTFKRLLWKNFPQLFGTSPESLDLVDLVDLVDRLLERFNLELSLQITKTLLEKIKLKKMVNHLQTLCIRNEVRYELCETLRRKYSKVCDNSAMGEEEKPLDDLFTRLYISTTSNNGPNIEHEVLTIGKLDSNQEPGKLLATEDIFSAERLKESYTKLLLIIGVAGSGKSELVRRLILDWIEGRSHQHVTFLFPLPFRELKQFEGSEISLLEIIQTLYPAAKKLRDEDYECQECQMMFVFDGLDEYSETVDFENTKLLTDHTEPASLNTIVVNLLRDRLLYRGLFVVTSRPQVQRYVPWDLVYDEIEVRGFRETEKDEYFRSRFQDPDQANRVIANINSVQTLRIMCHLPLFCSLLADEYECIFRKEGPNAEMPRRITGMYTKLLLVLTRQNRQFRASDHCQSKEIDFLMNLGQLAFNMLEQGNYKITKSDWKKVGIDEVEAVINSGLCTQYITRPFVLCQEKVLSFIHPTMQEYLAALYAFLSFCNKERNIFEQQSRKKLKGLIKVHKAMEVYKSAVDISLQREDRKLDIFLRFLFGMAARDNLELLQPFCTSSIGSTFTEGAATLIRKKITENRNPCRNSILQHCLEELGVCTSEATLH